jgi:hypothetical protein
MDDTRDKNSAKKDEPETERRRPQQGTFATGEERRVHHPEAAIPGDFAKGQEEEPESHEHRHKGSFATGEGGIEHPEAQPKGDFAEGEEDRR